MKRAFFVFVLLLMPATSGYATTMLWMDVEDLTRNSTAVVMGRVVVQKVLDSEPGVPLEQVTVNIDRTLKGDLKETVVVNNPGFPDAPVFQDGDDVILFIYTREGIHVLTGFQQGSFRIVTDSTGEKVLNRKIPSKDLAIAGIRSVDTLVSEILAAVD